MFLERRTHLRQQDYDRLQRNQVGGAQLGLSEEALSRCNYNLDTAIAQLSQNSEFPELMSVIREVCVPSSSSDKGKLADACE